MMNKVQILVLDFGSQYTQLIARRLREYGVYTEIVPYFESIDSIKARNPKGIILSGGPASVYEEGAYKPDEAIFELNIPILGICYGMQYIAHYFGGKVIKAEAQEFGKAILEIIEDKEDDEDVVLTQFHYSEFPQIAKDMLELWEESVKESYNFLEKSDFNAIKEMVYGELKSNETIIVASNKEDTMGFISGKDDVLKLLFISPKYRFCGVGSKLLNYALEHYVKDYKYLYTNCFLDNTQGIGFFKKLGFKAINIENLPIKNKSYPIVNLRADIKYLKEFLNANRYRNKKAPILRAPELIIRELQHKDLEDIKFSLQDNDEVGTWRFNFDFTNPNAQEWLNIQQESYKNFGFGLWALETLDGEFIGQVGLNIQDIGNNKKGIEVACLIKKEYWGTSYPYEGLRLCIRYAIHNLHCLKIYAALRHDDRGAIDRAKVFEMPCVGNISKEFDNTKIPHSVFCLTSKHERTELFIETEHTIIRELVIEDALVVKDFFENQEIVGANNRKAILDKLEAWICKEIDNYHNFGCGFWAIFDKAKDKFIGLAGLHFTKVSEVSIIISKDAFDKNYANELAEAIKDYAFKTYGMKEVHSICYADNKDACLLAKSLGCVETNITEELGEDIAHSYLCQTHRSNAQSLLLNGIKQHSIVWMSHADKVEEIPHGFIELAKSGNTHYCAIANLEKKIYAMQFHPEVVHSECGGDMLKNFAISICGADTSWNMKYFAENEIAKLKEKVLGDTQNTARCDWAGEEKIYQDYHDNEWGKPLHDEKRLFEMLVLEGMQAGLSWLTVLKKREAFREAFDDFDPHKVALYDDKKIEALMQNEKIIRNHAKIESAINNAKKFLEVQSEFGSFDKYIWGFVKNKPIINHFQTIKDIPASTPLSDEISKDLQKRGFKFVGSTIIYAFMQSIGMVDDHLESCKCKSPIASSSKTTQKVLCAVSGGVDSSVVATLLYRAIGENLIPVFVDTGLLRAGEREAVEAMFRENLGVPLITVDASEIFLGKLKGITDPEVKRKIIGETFIEVFEAEAKKHNAKGEIKFLAQGTLYPDVIESVSVKGPSKTIKSHHNVGGLPEWMKFELIEPLRELFKDEVRALGRELGMPEFMLMRHPFPGPGLAIRIMGEVNKTDLDLLRACDSIFIEELHKHNLYNKVWQAFCVLLNVKSVGVMGDNRTYDNTICVRAVEALDGMTATFSHLPHSFLEGVANRIINEVEGINRVVYDITSKPPGTIEWE